MDTVEPVLAASIPGHATVADVERQGGQAAAIALVGMPHIPARLVGRAVNGAQCEPVIDADSGTVAGRTVSAPMDAVMPVHGNLTGGIVR